MNTHFCSHGDGRFTQVEAEVRELQAVSSRYYLLRLYAPAIAKSARPGQFVMLSCTPADNDEADPLLARPLAVLDADSAGGEFQLLFFVAGRGTALLLQNARPGKKFTVVGPLGNGFRPVPKAQIHIGVGGGSGVSPLVFFFRKGFSATEKKTTRRMLILGARTAEQLPKETVTAATETILLRATDDGSAGFHGTAVTALKALPEFSGEEEIAVYAAGPTPMMRAATAAAVKRGHAAVRVSLEQRMACGTGVCRGCVVDAGTPHPKTGLPRRTVCRDGPVFDPLELAEGVL